MALHPSSRFNKIFRKYTASKIDQILDSVLSKENNHDSVKVDFVLHSVCDYFGITKKTIMQSNLRGEKHDAKDICYCLLHYDVGLKVRYISRSVFFNWPTSVSKGINRLRRINPKIKQDNKFLTDYNVLRGKLHDRFHELKK